MESACNLETLFIHQSTSAFQLETAAFITKLSVVSQFGFWRQLEVVGTNVESYISLNLKPKVTLFKDFQSMAIFPNVLPSARHLGDYQDGLQGNEIFISNLQEGVQFKGFCNGNHGMFDGVLSLLFS